MSAATQNFGQTTTTMNRPLYQKGDFGQEVALVQQYLTRAGFSPGAIDGKYGDKTVSAVAAFQQSQGLRADGVIWLDTFNALANASPVAPQPQPVAVAAGTDAGSEAGAEAGQAPFPRWAIYVGLAAAGAVALYFLTKRPVHSREALADYGNDYDDGPQCNCGPRHYAGRRRIRS